GAGRWPPGLAHTTGTEALWSSQQKAGEVWTVVWAAEGTGAAAPGFASASTRRSPTARATRGARTPVKVGCIPSHFLAVSSERRYATFFPRELIIRSIEEHDPWAGQTGISLGQVAVAAKANEITALPELLKL